MYLHPDLLSHITCLLAVNLVVFYQHTVMTESKRGIQISSICWNKLLLLCYNEVNEETEVMLCYAWGTDFNLISCCWCVVNADSTQNTELCSWTQVLIAGPSLLGIHSVDNVPDKRFEEFIIYSKSKENLLIFCIIEIQTHTQRGHRCANV